MPNPKNQHYLRSTHQPEEDELSLHQEDILEGLSESESSESDVSEADNDLDPEYSEMAARIEMQPFGGKASERGDIWLGYFERYACANAYNADKQKLLLPFFLKDHARVWFDALPEATKNDLAALRAEFLTRFNGNNGLGDASSLNPQQRPGESCMDFFTRCQESIAGRNFPANLQVTLLLNGLLPTFKSLVIMKNPQTLEEARQAICLAELTQCQPVSASVSMAEPVSGPTTQDVLLLELVKEIRSMRMDVNAYSAPKPHNEPYQDSQWAPQQGNWHPQQWQQPHHQSGYQQPHHQS
ncbi:MAG: hypothetical protein ABW185_04015 [Sedimenticola sp.]